ncbi:hypothetical protein CVT26_008881 [Gymnopilus dilepis]|uniref:Uncharacterized protein n=1 Tax=Gymnopilus dilepis TaxID=231916 RepID=A0A409YAY3_9AGAR|nr:hypothetical protein CVT26_008881 [Gymnopilus dilepis]
MSADYQAPYSAPFNAGASPGFNPGNPTYQPDYSILPPSNPSPDQYPLTDWARFSDAAGTFPEQQHQGYAQPIVTNWQAFESGRDQPSLNEPSRKDEAIRRMQSEHLPSNSLAPLTPGTVQYLQHPPSQVNDEGRHFQPPPSNSSSSSNYHSLPSDQHSAASFLPSVPSDHGSVASTQSSGSSVRRSVPAMQHRSTHPYFAANSSKRREELHCPQNSTSDAPHRRDQKATTAKTTKTTKTNPAFRQDTLQVARETFVAFCVSRAMLFPESSKDKKLYKNAASLALEHASSQVPGGPKPLKYTTANWGHLKKALITFREGWLLLILLLVGHAYKLSDTAAFEEALEISTIGAGEWLALVLTLTEQEILNVGASLEAKHPGKSLPAEYRNLKIAAFKDDDAVQDEFRWWGHRVCKDAATKMLTHCEGIAPDFAYSVCVARHGLPFLAVVNMTIFRAIRHYPKFLACSGSETTHTWDFDLESDELFLKHVLAAMQVAVQHPQGQAHLAKTLDEIYAKLPPKASLYKAIQPGYALHRCFSVVDSGLEVAPDTEGVGQ